MAYGAWEVSVVSKGWEKRVDDRSVYCVTLRKREVCDGEGVTDTG